MHLSPLPTVVKSKWQDQLLNQLNFVKENMRGERIEPLLDGVSFVRYSKNHSKIGVKFYGGACTLFWHLVFVFRDTLNK